MDNITFHTDEFGNHIITDQTHQRFKLYEVTVNQPITVLVLAESKKGASDQAQNHSDLMSTVLTKDNTIIRQKPFIVRGWGGSEF